MNNRLGQEFYQNHVVEVAKNLIGKELTFYDLRGIITETEAYRGEDDPASHAYSGQSMRNSIMFGPAGFVYVYMIYGMYYCLNIVTETKGKASAVLIRGLKLPSIHLNGPGKLCRYLGINKEHNGINIIDNTHIYVSEGIKVTDIIQTPRIGISKGQDLPWRFIANSIII